jgi:hypothetical protein
LAAGCASTPDESRGATEELGASATITFGKDFRQKVAGALEMGKTVRVDYDVDRLTECRGEQGGIPQWAITGFYKIDGGDVRTFAAGGLPLLHGGGASSFVLDRPGALEIWFQNTDRWGCNAYDSAFGANYHFDVELPHAH